MLEHEQRLREQTFLYLARNDDGIPVAIVVIGRKHVHRKHAVRECGARRLHQSPGRVSSGHWICDSSCVESSVSSASSSSTIGSISVRIVSSSESNMCTRTSRH